MDTPEIMWERFIERLNHVQPLKERVKVGKNVTEVTTPHQNFLGGISSYKKLFLEANQQSTPK